MSSDKWAKKTDKDVHGWTKEYHPSYGAISISHTSGNASLFESDVNHQHFITIRIKETCRIIDGTHEFLGEGRELIEINMSAAQFAEFITTPNRGIGTACTIRHAIGDEPYEGVKFGRPEPPRPEPFTDKFKGEGREYMNKMIQFMTTAKTMVDDILGGVTKPTKANLSSLGEALRMAIMQVQSNLPFVLKVLDEQTENRMQKAVTEFESYVSTRLQHMGLEALKAQAPRLTAGAEEVKSLPGGEDGNNEQDI